MKSIINLSFLIIVCALLATGCGSARKESVFECYDLNGDGHKQSITLTYEEDKDGTRTFYDGDTKVGERIDAIKYAEQKTNGMTCKSGTDRNN